MSDKEQELKEVIRKTYEFIEIIALMLAISAVMSVLLDNFLKYINAIITIGVWVILMTINHKMKKKRKEEEQR